MYAPRRSEKEKKNESQLSVGSRVDFLRHTDDFDVDELIERLVMRDDV
jgi:hypothetical protein